MRIKNIFNKLNFTRMELYLCTFLIFCSLSLPYLLVSQNNKQISIYENETFNIFKAIDKKVLKNELFNVEFKELKDGNYKTIAIYSKKARGLMTRFIIDNRITTIDKIKEFNLDKYIFSESLSSKYNFVFCR